MRIPRGVVLAVLVGGCSRSSSTPGPGGSSSPGVAPADGAYQITCSIYHRDLGQNPPAEHQRVPVVFQTTERGERAFEVSSPPIPARVTLSDGPVPNSLSLSVAFPSSGLTHQLALPARRPTFEFVGDQGFTGLMYVVTPGSTVDIQYICEASAIGEERPRPPRGPNTASGPEVAPPPPLPGRIRCDVGWDEGGTRRTDVIRVDSTMVQPSFDGPGIERRVSAGELDARVNFNEGVTGGRTIVLAVGPKGSSSGFRFQQLLQLVRSVPLENHLLGDAGLTGTVTVTPVADAGAGAVTVGCAAE